MSFLLAFFSALFGDLLRSHMLLRKADGLYSGGSTWGDLAWHLSMLSNFAQRGLSAVRENPIFPGTRLSYPFLPDLLSAWPVGHGVSLQASLIVPTFVALLGAVVAIYLLARSMTGSTAAALIAPFLYFFNGSIVGCYYLWQDYRNPGRDWLSFLYDPPKDYAHLIDHNLHSSNVVSDYVLPQRASVFGLCLGVSCALVLLAILGAIRTKGPSRARDLACTYDR
jgi:hypothetical protein